MLVQLSQQAQLASRLCSLFGAARNFHGVDLPTMPPMYSRSQVSRLRLTMSMCWTQIASLRRFVRVAVQADPYHCEGIYSLEQGQQINGQPVWINASGTRCIYQCPPGRWHVAGDDVMENGYVDSCGWLSQSAYSHGRLPYEVGSPWQRWNGSAHVVDSSVAVTVVATSST